MFNIGIDKPEISVNTLANIFIEKGENIFGYNRKVHFKKSRDPNYLKHIPPVVLNSSTAMVIRTGSSWVMGGMMPENL